MSLKQAIIVRNEYTIKQANGKGSRGSSPGKYISGYMARSDAVEAVAPIVRNKLDDFIMRYMARDSAVEQLTTDSNADYDQQPEMNSRRGRQGRRATLKQRRAERSARRAALRAGVNTDSDTTNPSQPVHPRELAEFTTQDGQRVHDLMLRAQGNGGVAFGYGDVSLSHDDLHAASNNVQELYENRHTVMKVVLSFTQDYLTAHGLIPEDLDIKRAGDYRGQVDQMKLRMAVMHGVDRLAQRHYDDLRYVGVIQVDTKHVHAHLTMVDAGYGHRAADGTQKGKINKPGKAILRRGIDAWLDQHQHMAHLSAAVGYEKRNVTSYVKRWAFHQLTQESAAQFVVACLPGDKRLWRASTNAKEMDKPNRLVRELVEARLGETDSPMPAALSQVYQYAQKRRVKEGLSKQDTQRLIDNGREKIIEQAMNGVYSVLSAISDEQRDVSTAMLTVMRQDYEDLLDGIARKKSKDLDEQGSSGSQEVGKEEPEPSIEEFGLRLRSYSARLNHHREQREAFAVKKRSWEDANSQGLADPTSQVMWSFYDTEEQYHAMCQSKYQHFLTFAPPVGQWEKQWAEVADYGKRVVGLRALRADRSLARMSDERAAEALGRQLYDQPGGGLLARTGAEGKAGRAVLDGRIERMMVTYQQKIDDLRREWAQLGARLEVEGDAVLMDAADLRESGGEGADERQIQQQTIELPVADVSDSVRTYLDEELRDSRDVSAHDPVHTLRGRFQVVFRPEHDFEQVRGADLHDLHYDWFSDQKVSQPIVRSYGELVTQRRYAFERAREWMISSQQEPEAVAEELDHAGADITRMEATSSEVSRTGILRSAMLARIREQARQRAQRAAEEQARRERELVAQRQQEIDQETTQPAFEVVQRHVQPESVQIKRGRTVALDKRVQPLIRDAVDRAVLDSQLRSTRDGGLG